jgi:glycosyltransferase involved in cell wall biosynthesis
MNLSIVIPLLNEEALWKSFFQIDKVCKSNSLSYEIWFVDDGSTDFRGALLRI